MKDGHDDGMEFPDAGKVEGQRNSDLNPLSKLDAGVEYANLVSRAGLAGGVWYRRESREFVLPLDLNKTTWKENTDKAYLAEKALKGKFPSVHFDFHLKSFPLSHEKETDLKENGYRWVEVSGVENSTPQKAL